MRKITGKLIALLTAASMLSVVSCKDKENSSSSSSSSSASESSAASDGEIEFVTNPDEPELGAYTTSESGTKLYYNPDEISPELMAALEEYFVSYSQTDYEAYTKCVYPDYITEMNEYLEADFGYDHKHSFESQCETLKTNAGGEFKITRIKAELPPEDGTENYFATLDEVFATDFYESVKNNTDKLYDIIFYVMVEAEGVETLLISEFEIVFAEKDGVLYTFG